MVKPFNYKLKSLGYILGSRRQIAVLRTLYTIIPTLLLIPCLPFLSGQISI